MKLFKTTEYRVTLLLIFALLVQIIAPIAENYVYANEVEKIQDVDQSEDITIEDDTREEDQEDTESSEGQEPVDETLDDDKEEEVPEDGEEDEGESNEGSPNEEEPNEEEEKDLEDVDNPDDPQIDTPDEENETEESTEEETEKDIEETSEEVEEEFIGPKLEGDIVPFVEEEKTNLGNIFTSAKLTVDNSEIDEDAIIEIKDKMEVKLELDWKLEDSVDLKSGDFAKIEIPRAFKGVSDRMDGDLKFGNEIVGSYEITNDGYLKVVFNDKLVNKKERKGEVGFLLEFNLKEFEDDASQTIKFEDPINKEFTITAKPGGETSLIFKSGRPDADINPEYINWVIDVNTSLEKLDNAIVEDIIPEGLELDFGRIEIYELKVGYEGKITEGDEIETLNPEQTDKGFKVGIGKTNKAYRIKYKTKIVDYPAEGYTNEVILKDGNKVKATDKFKIDKITRGSLIEKSGWLNGANKDGKNPTGVIWQIDINKAEQNLKNASIGDNIPNGLTLKDNAMRVWELIKKDNEWKYRKEITEDLRKDGKLKFPLELGDVEGTAYRIVFETDIEYGTEYKPSLEFENTATLKEGDEEVDSDKDEVTVSRDTLLEKNGTETTSYGNPEITWTIHVNKANHSIKNATITDTIGEGLKLRHGSIKVNGKEVPVGGDEYPRLVEQEDNSFILELGNIDSYYKIEYITDVTDPNLKSYSNKVELKGDGLTGDGIENGTITKEPSVNPSVNNDYSKSRADKNKEINGIKYDGLNYKEKTMSWLIAVDAKKELITELTITDTFDPEGSMVFMEDTLKIIKKVNNQDVVLVRDTDYALIPKGKDGFELKFKGELDRTKYEIYYKTSFDPDVILDKEVNGKLNGTKIYINKAKFEGKTKDVNDKEKVIETPDKTANYPIKDEIFNGGKKDGVLDREGRTITWKIYVNALGQNLKGQDFVIIDKLSEGQVFNRDSLVINVYDLDKDGTIEKSNLILFGYSLEVNDDKQGFTLTIPDGIDKPYVIEYSTNIEGISEKEYTNIADITSGDLKKTYKGKVDYKDHNKFVAKEASNIKGNTAYTDDEINWKVTLNESLSDIKNAVFKDIISRGHVYVNDSLKVYRGSVNDENLVVLKDGNLTIAKIEEGKTELKLELGDIDTVYIITYDTVVVATDGSITNDASLSGETLDPKGSGEKEFTVRQSSWGTGEGRDDRGSIKIYKIDGDTNLPIDAKFELYYYLNGEKQIVSGESKITEDGVLEFVNLPFRKYQLKEIEAPEGYKEFNETINIDLNKDDKTIIITVENYKLGSLSITKVDSKDKTKVLKGAEFRLTNNETKEVYTLITDEEGKVKLEGLPQGKYTLEETKAPSGYRLNSKPIEVVIGKDGSCEDETEPAPMIASNNEGKTCRFELDVELEIENTKRPPTNPEEPEKPTDKEDPEEPDRPRRRRDRDKDPDPKKPEKSIEPDKPVEITEYEKPTDPEEVEIEDEIPEAGHEVERLTDPEEEINLDDEIPQAGHKVKRPRLPKTGSGSNILYYVIGIVLLLVGIVLRKRSLN